MSRKRVRRGNDPVRVREDGALAWRASLQVRRRRYVKSSSGSARTAASRWIELGRVTMHDDFDALLVIHDRSDQCVVTMA